MDNESRIQVVVRLKTTEPNIQKAEELLAGLIEPIHANPKNTEFRVMQDVHDLTQFTLIENWEGLAAVKEHAQMPFMQYFAAVKDELFVEQTSEIIKEY